MADRILDDDLPQVPRVFTHITVAEEDDPAQAAYLRAMAWTCGDWERMTDEELVALAMEPEFLADCTPIAHELLVRLAARLESARAD